MNVTARLGALLASLCLAGCYGLTRHGRDGEPVEEVDGDSDVDSDTDTDVDTDGDVDGDTDVDSDTDGDVDLDDDSDDDEDDHCVGSGHDEDGDGVDDECDNCPTRRNPGQEDADHDGLGGRCEWTSGGRGEVFLDAVVFFDPFIAEIDGWDALSGSWELAEDALRGEASESEAVVLSPQWSDGTGSVETIFRLPDSPAQEDAWVGVVFAASEEEDGELVWWACLYEQRSHRLELWRSEAAEDPVLVRWDDTYDVGGDLIRLVRGSFDADGWADCAFVNELRQTARAIRPEDDPEGRRNLSGRTGLVLSNQTALFSSFVVYGDSYF